MIDYEKEKTAAELKGSLLEFTKFFFQHVTGREFIVSQPLSCESHHITIARELTKLSRLEIPSQRLMINVAPGFGKSVLVSMWMAWMIAQYPDSNFLYISFSHDLASKHTYFIKSIVSSSMFKYLFGISIKADSRAKDHFATEQGGIIRAFGSSGPVVGCFDYDEHVYTDFGLLKIGDIVERKLEVNAYSYNLDLKEFEFQPIVNWFENSENDIIKVSFSDGSTIQCTPNHRILTENRGYIRAEDLLTTDILLSCSYNDRAANTENFSCLSLGNGNIKRNLPIALGHAFVSCCDRFRRNIKNLFPASLDNLSIDSKLSRKNTHGYSYVFNALKLMRRKFVVLKFSPMSGPNTFCVSGAYATHPDVNNRPSGYTKFFGDIMGFSFCKSKFANFKNIFFGKFFKVVESTVIDRIFNILLPGSVRQIRKIIVKRVPVKMSYISFIRPWPNKRQANQRVHRPLNFLVTTQTNTHPLIARGTQPWLKNLFRFSLKKTVLMNNSSGITSNQPSVGNTVGLVSTRYKSPLDIAFVKHVKKTYCVEVKKNHNFIVNGSCGATIVGNSDAGLPGLDRFSGAVVIDDAHKPDEVHSDAIRSKVIRNYQETICQRPRGLNVPILFIGQRLHENDLPSWIEEGNDLVDWNIVKLKSLLDTGHALYPEVMPTEKLLLAQDKSPYVFASQYQQDPIPAGGALFRPEKFITLDNDPEMILTFITADTAETSNTWNDATVFSFFGLYEIEEFGRKTGQLGLHWIDCVELWIEPKDLRDNFLDFWRAAMLHPTPPKFAAIEKKSTGVTLISVLEEIRGLQIRNIERSRSSGSKSDRFIVMQDYINQKLVSLPRQGKHIKLCIEHMSKITANDTHRRDDIADTLADAVRMAFIDKTLHKLQNGPSASSDVLSSLGQQMRRQHIARTQRHVR